MVLLPYPRIQSKVCMKPESIPVRHCGVHRPIRAQPSCRYQGPATATLAGNSNFGVCLSHVAILSLDQFLPLVSSRSRIRDLRISSVHPTRVGMRATTRKNQRSYPPSFQEGASKPATSGFPCRQRRTWPIFDPTPGSLFAKNLACLKEFKYLGETGGLTRTVNKLT